MGSSGASSGGGFLPSMLDQYTRPAGSQAVTLIGPNRNLNGQTITGGVLFGSAVVLTAGQVINHIMMASGAQAAVTPSHQWFALYNSAFALLGATVDGGATAWPAHTQNTLTMASPYDVPTTGLYYVCGMVAAATPPTIDAVSNGEAPYLNAINPILAWQDNAHTGLTTPATAPATATPTAIANLYLAVLS